MESKEREITKCSYCGCESVEHADKRRGASIAMTRTAIEDYERADTTGASTKETSTVFRALTFDDVKKLWWEERFSGVSDN